MHMHTYIYIYIYRSKNAMDKKFKLKNHENLDNLEEISQTLDKKGVFAGVFFPFLYLALTLSVIGPFSSCNGYSIISGEQRQINVDHYFGPSKLKEKQLIYRRSEV